MADIPKYYPPLGFHFRVSFDGGTTQATDTYFQSVSGLSVQIQTETWKEGGENRFEHTLPIRTKYSDLVLKRGLFRPDESVWTDWFKNMVESVSDTPEHRKQNAFLKPRNLLIQLLNEKHEALAQWRVAHAWPKNWKVNDLNAERGEVLIESLELNYNYFTYERVGS